MLRPSRLNTQLSSYAQLEGTFDCIKIPLAPVGTKVLGHETTTQRILWTPHGVEGWYMGSAIQHYCYLRCYISSTNGKIIAKTVELLPQVVKIPSMSSRNAATEASSDLIFALNIRHQLYPH